MPVQPGDSPKKGPFSRGKWNRVEAAAEHYFRNFERGEGGAPPAGLLQFDRVTIKNVTGAARLAGEVVELGDYLLTDVTPEVHWFKGETVAYSQNRAAFGVLLTAAEVDAFVDCLLLGVCVARVNVSEAGHDYAELDDGQAALKSAVSGPAKILHKPTGTGEQLCVVVLGDDGPLNLIGKATEAIAKGTSGSCAIWAGVPGSEASTGLTVTAYNRVSDVASGDWLSLTRILRYWYLAPLDCPTEGA